jgi:hypothetical protein
MSWGVSLRAGALVAGALLAYLVALATAPAGPHPDFNDDGLSDLAVGTPFEGVKSPDAANGAVTVLHGTRHHLSAKGSQFLSEATPGMAGDGAQRGDFLGLAVASGDFNGDRRDDLAVGIPNENLGAQTNAGAVEILYAGAHRLSVDGSQFLSENTARMAGDGAEQDERFGLTLATGNFNGDGRDDLAIGVPNENLTPSEVNDDGAVHVLFGARGGLRPGSDQLLSERMPGVQHGRDSRFGLGLGAGDFNGDGRDDLAVGAPDRPVGGHALAGAVHVFHGGNAGLTLHLYQFLTEDTSGIAGGGSQAGAEFGIELTGGDFDGNRRDDLAIDAPEEDVDGTLEAGAVHLLYGSPYRLSLKRDQYLTQDTPGMEGDGAESGDCFGCSLAAGRFNRGRHDDLAIGVQYEDVAAVDDGAVHVVYGSRRHLSLRGNQFLSQMTRRMAGTAIISGDAFGFSVSAGDFNGDGRDDLAIGEPLLGSYCRSGGGGGLHVIYAGPRHLNLRRGNQFLTQHTPGMAGNGAEPCDGFGYSLASRAP